MCPRRASWPWVRATWPRRRPSSTCPAAPRPSTEPVRAHGSYQALVDDPEVDVVYIGTPHPDHASDSMRARDRRRQGGAVREAVHAEPARGRGGGRARAKAGRLPDGGHVDALRAGDGGVEAPAGRGRHRRTRVGVGRLRVFRRGLAGQPPRAGARAGVAAACSTSASTRSTWPPSCWATSWACKPMPNSVPPASTCTPSSTFATPAGSAARACASLRSTTAVPRHHLSAPNGAHRHHAAVLRRAATARLMRGTRPWEEASGGAHRPALARQRATSHQVEEVHRCLRAGLAESPVMPPGRDGGPGGLDGHDARPVRVALPRRIGVPQVGVRAPSSRVERYSAHCDLRAVRSPSGEARMRAGRRSPQSREPSILQGDLP